MYIKHVSAKKKKERERERDGKTKAGETCGRSTSRRRTRKDASDGKKL